jgi:hypothetical protein
MSAAIFPVMEDIRRTFYAPPFLGEALRRVASCILSFRQETTLLSMDLPPGFTGICRDMITVFCLVRCKKEPDSEDTETNCRE